MWTLRIKFQDVPLNSLILTSLDIWKLSVQLIQSLPDWIVCHQSEWIFFLSRRKTAAENKEESRFHFLTKPSQCRHNILSYDENSMESDLDRLPNRNEIFFPLSPSGSECWIESIQIEQNAISSIFSCARAVRRTKLHVELYHSLRNEIWLREVWWRWMKEEGGGNVADKRRSQALIWFVAQAGLSTKLFASKKINLFSTFLPFA